MVVVREAIVAAAMMLGIGEEVKENVSNYANPKTPEVELLIQCFNLVENELAVDYMPPIKEETCEIDDGKLYFEDLEYEILRVLWVKNIAGEEIPFQIYPEYLALKENTVKIPKFPCLRLPICLRWEWRQNMRLRRECLKRRVFTEKNIGRLLSGCFARKRLKICLREGGYDGRKE